MKNRVRSSQGAALVITLLFVTLITLIAIGFVGLMQFEMASATQHLGGIEADLFAREAESLASSRLYAGLSNTTVPWMSQPGAIYVGGTNWIELSSGYAPEGESSDKEVDLNPGSLTDSGRNLIGLNSPMIVQWIYQYQDGTFVTQAANIPPAYNSANPVIGRLGFWVDDESAKLNLNTAAGKELTNAISNPAQVNLGTNATDMAGVLAYRNAVGHFNSVAELGRATNISTAFTNDGFELTTYSHAPAPRVNMLGLQPILLTTQAKVAQACGYTNFLDILNTPNTDPGLDSSINQTKATAVLNKIVAALGSTAWPILPGKSFAAKYYDPLSIAANIIDYVRSAESSALMVEPLQLQNISPPEDDGELAVGRHPVLCEMCAFFPPSPYNTTSASSPNFYSPVVAMQVYFPKVAGGWNNNGAGIPLSLMQARVDVAFYYGTQVGGDYTFTDFTGALTSADLPGAQVVMPGGYAMIESVGSHVAGLNSPRWRAMGPFAAGQSPDDVCNAANDFVQMKMGLLSAATSAYYSVMDNQTANEKMTVQVTDPTKWVAGNPLTLAVDDPLLNYWNSSWVPDTTDIMGSTAHSKSTLNQLSTLPAIFPQQDTDGSGKLVEGVVVPAPAGSPQNPYGIVQSLGELGFIHTGLSHLSSGQIIPWRTVRLQPERAGSTDLPDWLMLNLFAVPTTNAVAALDRPFLQPNNLVSGTTTNICAMGGQVNLNGGLMPFSNYPSELLPLESVLTGITNNSPDVSGASVYTLPTASAPTVSTNLVGYVEAVSKLGNVSNQGRSFTNTVQPNNIFLSPGQVAEIAGVADAGEASEEMVRQLTALTTVGSDVFTIYSVGQSLKQDTSGRLHLEGESRRRETVERLYDADGTVHLQTVSSARLQL